MYQIAVDRERALIRVKHAGFFTVEEVRAYAADLARTFIGAFGARPYSMVIDIADCAIQSQEVIRAFKDHIAAFPKAQRLAVVTGQSLARRQLLRILPRDYLESFETDEQADQWLRDAA